MLDKKKISYGIIAFFLFLIWCIMSINESKNTQEQKQYKDKITITNASVDKNEIYNAGELSYQEIDLKKAINFLFPQKKNCHIETDGEKIRYVQNEKGDYLQINDNGLVYNSADFDGEYDSVQKYNRTNGLSFGNAQEIYNQICKFMASINIPVDKLSYSCYVVRKNGKTEGNNKEYYYFSIWQTVNDCPLISNYFGNDISSELNVVPINVIYSKNGFEYLYMNQLYSLHIENTQIDVLSLDEIIERIEFKYNQLINGATYYLDRADLGYLILTKSEKKKIVVPVWIAYIIENNNKETYQYLELYNALTGEEIVL